MQKPEKLYPYKSTDGKTYSLAPKLNMYAKNDNLYLGFDCYDKREGFIRDFLSATVNIIPLAYLEAVIDTNNNSSSLVDFLEENGFGQRTPFAVQSGFCAYPIFLFNEDKMKEIDPKLFAEYQKTFGMDKAPLESQIQGAGSRSSSVAASSEPNAKETGFSR